MRSVALICALLGCSAGQLFAQPRAAESTAFFYGPNVPRELSAAYQQIVVEPGHVPDVPALARAGATPVAYFSIGEVSPDKLKGMDPSWIAARNSAWGSAVMDLGHAGYQDAVIARFEQLWSLGYRRFFLDTLDSYQLASKEPAAREHLRRALCRLIVNMATRHPEARWLLNRGFELLPDTHKHVHGIVAESLFDRFDAGANSYVRVPEGDRSWLLGKLREVVKRYQLPVIVIDYRPSNERDAARETARKISALGFQPWVCNGAINDVGVGPREILPRRVLILSNDPAHTGAHDLGLWLAPVIEYLGYVPEYRRVGDGLPSDELAGRYAGIVTVFPVGSVPSNYDAWLLRQVHAGVRVAIFGGLGFAADGPVATELGLAPVARAKPGTAHAAPVAVVTRDDTIGFEAEPPARDLEGVALRVEGDEVVRHLELRTGHGQVATAIASTRFGGVALSHVVAIRGLSGERAWILDPFKFLSRALALPTAPVPDVTTESGSRVALFAVASQGLADHARLRGRPRIASVLREQFLAKHAWPHALAAARESTPEDERLARALLDQAAAYGGELVQGKTAERGSRPTLTGVEPLWNSQDPEHIPLPIAADSSFIAGASEAYPLRRVLETFAYTDAPRRLRPLALHYHAFALSSPGGIDALSAVYNWLNQQPLFPVRVRDYRARIAAFREQVITRELNGSFCSHGGEALRTWRVPQTLGSIDGVRSIGVGAQAELPQGRYVTFVNGKGRCLAFTSEPRRAPYIEQANGSIVQLVVDAARVRLRVAADAPVLLRVAGLHQGARCNLVAAAQTYQRVVDARGRVEFALATHDTGSAQLSCAGSHE